MTGISQDLQTIMGAADTMAKGAADLQREAAAVHALEGMIPWLASANVLLEVMREAYIFSTAWFEETLIQDAKVLEAAATGLAKWAADMAAVEQVTTDQLGAITDVLGG